ncbi:HlyD family secretion protein [Mucilaginibacter gossypiicola]|uniref:HlyD family secretion protein n=1 Tax=Mucilaginibacter gossypiicola TaxID=551995 RepID=A0A1H8BCK9_9SPHI|nr:HlyD family efflux transporter periplasmic adaptor subunit [Mucilaginibacter gossypiicola]SEM79728.1 HlyD family secretion protein [Mucilaginibacter gossypiicola]
MNEETVKLNGASKGKPSLIKSAIIEERSELAQEIISSKPDFWEKWSLYIFLFFLLCIIAFTWIIKYPEVIEVKAILTAKNAPKEIISRQEGRLVKLFVRNNQIVSKNQIIGWIESTADHAEVIELSREIDSCIDLMNKNQTDEAARIFSVNFTDLGELQTYYQQFIAAWQEFNDYKPDGFYSTKKRKLLGDVNSLERMKSTIQNQKKLTEKDVELAEESYKMNKTLLDRNVLTKEEFRTQTSKFVNKQLAIPQLDNTLLENETQKRSKLSEINQLDHDFAQQKIIFRQILQSLKSHVDEWLKNYVIKSPVDGKAYFIIPLQENQYIQTNRLLGYINPKEDGFYAETNLSQFNFGKITTGLSVQLRFDAYPYEEVGYVPGKLFYISNVPSDSGFRAMIRLSKGLKTSNNNEIPYKSGLKAQALIVTRDMTLFNRVYYNLVKSISIGKK